MSATDRFVDYNILMYLTIFWIVFAVVAFYPKHLKAFWHGLSETIKIILIIVFLILFFVFFLFPYFILNAHRFKKIT